MMMMMVARRRLTLIGVNLWQTGVRSLFNYYQFRFQLTQDDAWANVRAEMEAAFDREHDEWEYQQVRAVLYEELNMTVEIAEEMYRRFPDSTPLIDAIKVCLSKPVPIDESE